MIKDIGHYIVHSDGTIISKKLKRPLKPTNMMGYRRVKFYDNKSKKCLLVHRLVAQIFIPNPLNLPEVNHKNGIKTDNRFENLEWVTHAQNIQHAYDNGMIRRTYRKKFDHSKIIERRTSGASVTQICNEFKISRSSTYRIVNGCV